MLDIVFALIFFLLLIVASSIKIVREYERAVKFRLGRYVGIRGPGIFFILPSLEKFIKVDLRTVTLDVPKQRVVTRDNVTVDVDAVVYLRVVDPASAVLRVENYLLATSLLAQTTLRDVLGQSDLDELLSKRDEINKRLQSLIDEATDAWGIKVSAVTIRDVALPSEMLRAIAKQAEAERERRSRVIMAEGEYEAAKRMTEAAQQYEQAPAALRLRELQTLVEIAREKNLVVVSPTQIGAVGEIIGLVSALEKKEKKRHSEISTPQGAEEQEQSG